MFIEEFLLEIDEAFSSGIKPIKKDFFDLDENGKMCAGCAIGAAYAKAHPEKGNRLCSHDASQWALRKFNLTLEFLEGFLFGFDGIPLSPHYQEQLHAQDGHKLGEQVAEKWQPIDP